MASQHPFIAMTMALFEGHHAFSWWNGDRRYFAEHGDDFLKLKGRTSIVPFQAISEGRQVLPKDYYKELLRAQVLPTAHGRCASFSHEEQRASVNCINASMDIKPAEVEVKVDINTVNL
jgi:hypothetical protein